MHPNAELIERFYRAFAAKDPEPMVKAYADAARFSDPVFPDLSAAEARGMWRMLTGRAKDLEITFRDVSADDRRGRAHWEARYTFTATGRSVHNVIDAEFELADGRIVRHVDRFDFWRWSRMALGPSGTLLGWTPFLQRKVQTNAKKQLEKFLASLDVQQPAP
jgi:hypothetical protein